MIYGEEEDVEGGGWYKLYSPNYIRIIMQGPEAQAMVCLYYLMPLLFFL